MVVVDSSEKHFATVFDLWCFVNDNAQGSHCYFVSPDDCVVSINLAHDVDSTRNFEHFSTFISRSGSGYFRLTRNEDELKLILNDPIVISKSREKGKEEVKMDLNQFPKEESLLGRSLLSDIESPNLSHIILNSKSMGSAHMELMRSFRGITQTMNTAVSQVLDINSKAQMNSIRNVLPDFTGNMGRFIGMSQTMHTAVSQVLDINSKAQMNSIRNVLPDFTGNMGRFIGMSQTMNTAVSQAFDISSKAEMNSIRNVLPDLKWSMERCSGMAQAFGGLVQTMREHETTMEDVAQQVREMHQEAIDNLGGFLGGSSKQGLGMYQLDIDNLGGFSDAYISEIKERREHEETMEDLARQGLEMHQEAIDKQEIQEKEKEQLIENAVARGVSKVISKLDKDNVIVKDNEVKIKDSKRCINEGGDKYYMSDNIKVFISYCSEDGVQSAKELKNILNTKDGVGCFFAQDDILYGDDLLGKMDEALNSMNVFIPIMTAQYSQSKWCMYELGYARRRQNQDNNISIVPIKVGNEPDKDFLFGKYIDWDEIRESADTRDVAEVAAEFIEKVIDRKHRPRE